MNSHFLNSEGEEMPPPPPDAQPNPDWVDAFDCVARCVAQTVQIDDECYCVSCSLHGPIFTYSVVNIRMFGAKAVQQKIDVAWLTHAATHHN